MTEPDMIDKHGTMRVDGMILYLRERGLSPEATGRALDLRPGVVRNRIQKMRDILAERQGDQKESAWQRLTARLRAQRRVERSR